MQKFICLVIFLSSMVALLSSCATGMSGGGCFHYSPQYCASVLPPTCDTHGKRMVVIDPNVHAWGAYGEDGHLVRAGMATAGARVCPPDAGHGDCRTGIGTFHVSHMGDGGCYSKKYPAPHGGGLMPYCMYFHEGQAMHGSPDNIVVPGNISHGCVRMLIPDAEWMRNDFAYVGMKVKVLPYSG